MLHFARKRTVFNVKSFWLNEILLIMQIIKVLKIIELASHEN